MQISNSRTVRVDRRRTNRVLIVTVLATLAYGCATKAILQVERDPAADFSQYSTWSWFPIPSDDDRDRSESERELSRLVWEQIVREFAKRGFHYQRQGADLGVGARLRVGREKHVISQIQAIETLNSLHTSPSYEIQATNHEVKFYERGRLTIRVTELRRNQEVWRGEYTDTPREIFAPHAKEAVTITLESFPGISKGSDPAPH
ncbi:MAG: DUF4136 domain-containing protein [Myxococcales bacterium]|nr:DUF4136 domain-containing protein [Myxococcales bacterium]